MCYNKYVHMNFEREAIKMKKLLGSIMAVLTVLSLSLTAIAATSNISIKNNVSDSKPVSYSYDADKSGEIVKSIKSLMTKLEDIGKQSSVVQTLTITSESANNAPVAFKLRLAIPEKAASDEKPEAIAATPSPDEISALDYYNIKITDRDGNVIYTYEDDESAGGGETYKDMPLGTLNVSDSSENKIFNLTISVNKDMDKNSIADEAEKLDWQIVSDIAIIPTEEAKPQTQSTPKADSKDTVTLEKGEYICGKDIEPGRYTMTGNGKVHVYATDGALKSTIALKDKDDETSNGVAEYIINLAEDEKVVVDDVANFTPYSSAKATATPKGTATPKATATPKTSATTQPTDKSNPKTGDSAPIIGVSILAIAALAGAALIVIKKKKEN